jgi:hypothetical protein
MRVGRLIRRAVPLIALGAAATVAARNRAQARERLELMPGPVAAPAPAEPPEPEAEPGVSMVAADEQMTVEVDALDDEAGASPDGPSPASMTDIVDDLLAPGPDAGEVEEATVVDGPADETSRSPTRS